MRFLGLEPDAVVARSAGATVNATQASAARSTLLGALGFGVASLLVFGSWAVAGPALYRMGGEAGAYLVWAAAFILLSGAGLSGLVVGHGNRMRFLAAFAIAFSAYAAVWMAGWFALRNRTGEVAGAVGGTAAFALVLCRTFGTARAWPDVALHLFIGNTVGYFTGSAAYDSLGGTAGKLAWGALYGIGFGAGIGASLHRVQEGVRLRLQARSEPGPAAQAAP
ncbi:MAG: hypothetical protein KF791_01475 [Verrucomicrobiae bacterium]|nr:hypothetical protein [Verrucomicrobiae bacterium]